MKFFTYTYLTKIRIKSKVDSFLIMLFTNYKKMLQKRFCEYFFSDFVNIKYQYKY